jgi:hypothetical protein
VLLGREIVLAVDFLFSRYFLVFEFVLAPRLSALDGFGTRFLCQSLFVGRIFLLFLYMSGSYS